MVEFFIHCFVGEWHHLYHGSCHRRQVVCRLCQICHDRFNLASPGSSMVSPIASMRSWTVGVIPIRLSCADLLILVESESRFVFLSLFKRVSWYCLKLFIIDRFICGLLRKYVVVNR